jgi:hypothetical protein
MDIDKYKIEIGIKHKSQILKIINEKLYNKVFRLIYNIKDIYIIHDPDGFTLTIRQSEKECDDVIVYFIERFKKNFPEKKPSNFYFIDYKNIKNVSHIYFYYKYNLFEKAIFNTRKSK